MHVLDCFTVFSAINVLSSAKYLGCRNLETFKLKAVRKRGCIKCLEIYSVSCWMDGQKNSLWYKSTFFNKQTFVCLSPCTNTTAPWIWQYVCLFMCRVPFCVLHERTSGLQLVYRRYTRFRHPFGLCLGNMALMLCGTTICCDTGWVLNSFAWNV